MINFTKIISICFILISTLSFAQKLSKEHLRNFPKENGFYKTFVLSKYNNKLRANVVLHSDFLKDKDGDLTENVLISFLKKENSWLANDVQVIVKCRGKCINYIDEDTNALYRNNFFYFEFSFDGPRYSGYLMALSILPHLMTTAAKKHGLENKIVILTATSGDTGKAAMAGFADVPGTEIIVFYPKDGVSKVQELQMKIGRAHV